MNSEIYIILKSLTVEDEGYYESVPSTWCDTAEDAAELLTKTLKRLQEWYPDIEVLAHDNNRLHVHYHDDEGQFHDAVYWIQTIRKFDGFAW